MKSKVIGGVVVLGIIGVKFLLKVGVGLGIGAGVTEAEIEASRLQDWPKEFKQEYIEGCIDGNADPAVKKYCSCIANTIEAAHLIPTKYNGMTSDEEGYTKKIIGILEEYHKSEAGLKADEVCIAKAKES